jgi:hypothetical protein
MNAAIAAVVISQSFMQTIKNTVFTSPEASRQMQGRYFISPRNTKRPGKNPAFSIIRATS